MYHAQLCGSADQAKEIVFHDVYKLNNLDIFRRGEKMILDQDCDIANSAVDFESNRLF